MLDKKDTGPFIIFIAVLGVGSIWGFMIPPPQKGMEPCSQGYFFISTHVYQDAYTTIPPSRALNPEII
jgi:hypothetical protein